MSYTPTTWHKGDKVTTEKLNKIEQGIVDAEQSGSSLPDYSEANDGDVLTIENGAPAWKEPSGGGGSGSGAFLIEQDINTGALNKTWQEIFDAIAGGQTAFIVVVIESPYTTAAISSPVMTAMSLGGSDYIVASLAFDTTSQGFPPATNLFVATTANDYPVQQQG